MTESMSMCADLEIFKYLWDENLYVKTTPSNLKVNDIVCQRKKGEGVFDTSQGSKALILIKDELVSGRRTLTSMALEEAPKKMRAFFEKNRMWLYPYEIIKWKQEKDEAIRLRIMENASSEEGQRERKKWAEHLEDKENLRRIAEAYIGVWDNNAKKYRVIKVGGGSAREERRRRLFDFFALENEREEGSCCT